MRDIYKKDEREVLNYNQALANAFKITFSVIVGCLLISTVFDAIKREISLSSVLLLLTLLIVSIVTIIQAAKHDSRNIAVYSEEEYKGALRKIRNTMIILCIPTAFICHILFNILPQFFQNKSIKIEPLALIDDFVFMTILGIIFYFIEKQRIKKEY
ncbi:hypothetical protein KYI11_05525 [Macrococcoides bohemicum]|uniref:DUF3278 domain-containing protein n=1 Tax=Macrococcoides bohemicum TaxID=1903056 RepID=A0AAJ4PCA0_9STAP|nr:hypothetical protein [Macrococcus bohemicus]QYA43368.1 hypothetical protein KYI11_05525 [Macrococcus bohemicus]